MKKEMKMKNPGWIIGISVIFLIILVCIFCKCTSTGTEPPVEPTTETPVKPTTETPVIPTTVTPDIPTTEILVMPTTETPGLPTTETLVIPTTVTPSIPPNDPSSGQSSPLLPTSSPTDELIYHFSFDGYNNDGLRKGLSEEAFHRLIISEGCKLDWGFEDNYMYVYYEGGVQPADETADCQFKFSQNATDSFRGKQIDKIIMQFSLSYYQPQSDPSIRSINYHFYPKSLDGNVLNDRYHESQFTLNFKCTNINNNEEQFVVTYSNGFRTFFKTVERYNDQEDGIKPTNEIINRYNTDVSETEHYGYDRRIPNVSILEENRELFQPIYVFYYKHLAESFGVYLYRSNTILDDVSQFPAPWVQYSWEQDIQRKNKSGELSGGFDCFIPDLYSFGVKLVGDGGIEARIYDIYVITKPSN